MRWTRRECLVAGGAALLSSGMAGCRDGAPYVEPGDWNAGDVAHLLPAATHERIRLKASLHGALAAAPVLSVDERDVAGLRGDAHGRFWRFDVSGLSPQRTYTLALRDAAGNPLCDPWRLRTFPAPQASPARFRLLAYTCAGGPEFFGGLAFLPVEARRRLLARGLSFAPDAVLANGDHIYWDLKSGTRWALGASPQARWSAGRFDREAPILGGANEEVLVAGFGPQIADLYGTLLRSTPAFFVVDDHDYTENDEANDDLRTFPADAFMTGIARATQQLYYPELLDTGGLGNAYRTAERVGPSFGRLRYGTLLESWLYDCRAHLANATDSSTGDEFSGFVPAEVEAWLIGRQTRSDAAHLMHVPSTPVLWTAGKWGEWYPDFLDETGALSLEREKPWWPRGWNAQHDRLLAAASARRDRVPLFASGDLHATAAGRIARSGERDFSPNPVVSLLTGTLGTGPLGWPSRIRGTPPRPSQTLDTKSWVEPLEENGFTLLDFDRDGLKLALFRWKPDDGIDAIETLEPFRVIEIPVRGGGGRGAA
jgi:hypothetical protein